MGRADLQASRWQLKKIDAVDTIFLFLVVDAPTIHIVTFDVTSLK
jgi:hypothetical protein